MTNKNVLNYTIDSKISEGGMGIVYAGHHNTLGRKVAIKVLLPELANDPQIIERFINEANTLSKLTHQNIVSLYDLTNFENNLYLIMEYIDGVPLDRVISQNGAFHPDRCIDIFNKILEGFRYAHSKGIVHRDIKPSNIMLQTDDVPKILDFGIAKIVEGNAKLTKTGTRLGSVMYMSPEQVLGRDVDFRSDIYSLGVTLFEMITGSAPYGSTTSEYEIQTNIVNNTLYPLTEIRQDLNPVFQHVINKATEKDPAKRFQTCAEFVNALQSNINYSPNVRTVIQPVPDKVQYPDMNKTEISTPNSKKNFIIMISFAALILVTAAIIIFFTVLKSDEADAPSDKIKTANTEPIPEKKPVNNVNKDETITNVKNAVYGFLSCWSDKDLNCLESYLTSDYQYETATGSNKYQDKQERLSVWQKQFRERSYILVSSKDIEITVLSDNTARASYMQTYTSDKYSDSGVKVLYFRFENNKWKIYKDSFY